MFPVLVVEDFLREPITDFQFSSPILLGQDSHPSRISSRDFVGFPNRPKIKLQYRRTSMSYHVFLELSDTMNVMRAQDHIALEKYSKMCTV